MKKELLPLVDRAILDHTLDRLVRHGVHEVVMSSPYLEDLFHPFIESRRGEPTITWVTEREALDTGGAIVNAVHRLEPDEPFFALNGDILTDLDMTAMLALHREHDAAATIALHHVEDARAFGLVELAPEAEVPARAARLRDDAYSIHFHVWTPAVFAELVHHCAHEEGIPLGLEALVPVRHEFIAVLRRTH